MALLLVACGQPTHDSPLSEQAEDEGVECAIGPDAGWSDDCRVEQSAQGLTIRHPDGGFRRFRQLADGRGLEAADGAEVAQLQIVDQGRIEIRIGGDRYRLPAKVAAQAQ